MNTLNTTLGLLDERALACAYYVVTSLYIVGLNLAQAHHYYAGGSGSFCCRNWMTQIGMRTGPIIFGASQGVWLLVILTSIDILGRFAVLGAVAAYRRRIKSWTTPCQGA